MTGAPGRLPNAVPYRTRKIRAAAGFTLIELLVVVVIVGILSSIGASFYPGYIRSVNLEKAVPYLLSISSKQQVRFNRTGKYLTTLSEQDVIDRLGVAIGGVEDFCFMIFCEDNTICVDNADSAAAAGSFVSTPTGNTPLYQVVAVLRADDDATVSGAGSTCTMATNPAKTDPTGWVRTAGNGAGSEGRVIVLSYPPPADGLMSSSQLIAGHTVTLDWDQGITKTDAELE